MQEVVRVEVVTSRDRFSKIMNVAKLGGMLDDVQLCFKPDALEVNVKNPENTLGCYARFDKTYFDSYNVPEEMKIAFSVGRKKSKIEKILKQIESKRGGLRIGVDGNSLTINGDEFIIPLKSYDESMEFPRINLKQTEFGYLMIHDEIDVENYNYTSIIVPKSLNLLGTENLTFVVANGTMFVRQQDELGYKVKTEISSMLEKHVKDVSVTVDATLMEYAFKTIGNDCYIAVGEKDGMPLPIELYAGDATHFILVLVAPKLEE